MPFSRAFIFCTRLESSGKLIYLCPPKKNIQMDRNTMIGFGLIAVLLIAMFAINSKSRLAYEAEKKRIEDSVAASKPKPVAAARDTVALDTNRIQPNTNDFQTGNQTEEVLNVENEVLKVSFTNKGGQQSKVVLKKFDQYSGGNVVLQEGSFNKLSYSINAGPNKVAQTGDMYFKSEGITKNADGSQTVRFVANDSSGKKLTHEYIIRPGQYMIDLNISADGAPGLFTQNSFNLSWQTEAKQVERDHKYELTQTH